MPYVTLFLMSWWILYVVAACLDPASFALSFEVGADNTVLVEMGAKVDPLVSRGEVHRLVLSTFLHSGLTHLVVNSVWFLALAWLWRRLGMKRMNFMMCFLAGAVGGQVVSFGLSMGPSVGASGGIYSLLAAFFVGGWRMQPEPLVRVIYCVAVGLFLGVPVLLGPVDHAAHFGGFIVGMCVTLLATKVHRFGPHICFLTAVLCLSCFAPLSPQPDLPIPAIQPDKGGFSMGACMGLEAQGVAPCVREPSVLFVASLSLKEMAVLDPQAMDILPSVGKHVRYSAQGQTVFMHRSLEDALFVIATDSGLWPRFQSSIKGLNVARFPGT